MLRSELDHVVADVLRHRRLLDHPFYRRWEAGALEPGELGAYAAQYRHFERTLPVLLARVVDQLPDGVARRTVQANLDDELGVPEPHTTMFEDFASAVGAAESAPPTAATAALIDTYDRAAKAAPARVLAALAVYEVQAPSVAASKAAGLRAHYGVDARGTRFWDVHADMDARHAEWALDAVAALAERPDDIAGAADDAARAWWAFLDDRDADAPLASAV